MEFRKGEGWEKEEEESKADWRRIAGDVRASNGTHTEELGLGLGLGLRSCRKGVGNFVHPYLLQS